jgi:hypothetical protein
MQRQICNASGASTASQPVVYDIFHAPFNVSIFAVISPPGATVNYTVQHTGDDIINIGALGCTWFSHGNSDLVNATSNQNDNFAYPVSASRVFMNSQGTAGTEKVTMTCIQAGCPGGMT